MILNRISIEAIEVHNFKRFYGQHRIALLSDPDANKPLILIGGDNGSGKTSLHEAVNYALFEDDDLPGIATRPNYLKAISERLNRKALDEGDKEFGVALELALEDGTAVRKFRIERSWDVDIANRRALRPQLKISENGRPIDFVEDSPAAYQDFVRSVLPPQIAPFFFFDGERIQDFAEEDQHGRAMVEAIKDILHINVYRQLEDDLRRYVIDHIEKFDIEKSKADDFFELLADRERLEDSLEQKRDKLGDVERQIDEFTAERKRVEGELKRIASPHASERDDLIAERDRLDTELQQAKSDLKSSFETLPLLLAGRLRSELTQQLVVEQTGVATTEQLRNIKSQLGRLKTRLFDEALAGNDDGVVLTSQQREFLSTQFDRACEEIFGLSDDSGLTSLHDIGTLARDKILNRLGSAETAANALRDALNRRERLTNDHRDVEIKLQSTSEDPHTAKLLDENRSLSERVGGLETQATALRGELQRLEADLNARLRQIQDRQEKRKATTKAKQAVKLAQKGRHALQDFTAELARQRLGDLRHYMSEMYERLKKFEDPVSGLEIDPETWQVLLKDDTGRPLEKRVFSAGMKEMYALSLLWALARSSKRDLPIIIDTPVGRLDTTNRRALFEKYLPYAGHQVIVLSTDTEIDKQWAARLSPYVACQYHLEFDRTLNSTVVRPGYFF